jgi:hypothetical protein
VRPQSTAHWERLLSGLHAEALDCLQTSIALVADEAYGSGSHVALGSGLRWDVTTEDGITRVRRSLDDRLAESAAVLAVGARAREPAADGAGLRRMLAAAGRLCVVADAYHLPWVPYAGHRHMAHSFLLEGADREYRVVDGYRNETQWGPARPGVWMVSRDELDSAVAASAEVLVLEAAAAPPSVDEAVVAAENAARARAAGPAVEAYLRDVRSQIDRPEALEQLVLDVWLLARERLLHAAWLGRSRGLRSLAGRAEALAEAWKGLATRSYVAVRRARRGPSTIEPVLDDLAGRLRADLDFAASVPEAEAAAVG